MTAANLLNLNVDSLFEQHSVPEIDVVHKKIQTVVENKREELRTMVGERYRDLLKAADTIAAMQTSAATLIEQVQCVHSNGRSLNEQQLLGFKTTPSMDTETLLRQRHANKQQENYYSTMVQIKLLTSLPELIWTHIDHEQFNAATELFIFSRHISTGLQLDSKNALMQQLPVARKQWEILRPFHVTIKQSVLAVLEREHLGAEVAVDCMQSLLLLNKCDLVTVLQTFLQLRSAAFLNCLQQQESSADVDKKRRVKDRILASLNILNGTVELLDMCLLADGLLFQRMAECTVATAPPSITRMDSSERQLAHLLPDIISSFRPNFVTPKISETQLRTALQEWLQEIDEMTAAQLKQLFALVSNMQIIQDIKTVANLQQHSFAHLEQQLNLPNALNFYYLKYVPQINARVREIIRSSWAAAMQQTFERVQQLVEQPLPKQQFDIWQEQSCELPQSLAAALSDNLARKRLSNKTKGYDAAIVKICFEFDAQLEAIVKELNVLLTEQTTRAEDKLSLIAFLCKTAQEQLTKYIGQLKMLQLRERQALLQALRSTLALVELCPHLKLCFCQPSSWRQWTGQLTSGGVEQWQRMCALLEEEILQLWLLVIDDVLATHSYADRLPKEITHEVLLSDFALWQTQTLEQRDEQEDRTVQSNIRIPSQPRLSLQSYLFELIHDLNSTVPQTLPVKVLQAFNQKLLGQLLLHYEVLANAEDTKSSQNIALQLYFDLKFLQQIFAVNREERKLYEQFQGLQHTLRDYIDPFDFELFAEHITTQIARSTSRLQGELGVLTPASQVTMTAASATALAHEADPNVLCLSSSGSTSLWFPLLPIVMPTTSSSSVDLKSMVQESEKQAALAAITPTRKAATTRKSDTSKSKSSAASFFGMSQEWFR